MNRTVISLRNESILFVIHPGRHMIQGYISLRSRQAGENQGRVDKIKLLCVREKWLGFFFSCLVRKENPDKWGGGLR